MKAYGRCWKFGDNVPTDQIVRSDRALATIEEMAKHALENLNPLFPVEVKKGDILVAGRHFGQSSGRAVAPKAIKATGISLIIVEYSSRLFYRNCFEIGLPLLECPNITKFVNDGDILSVDITKGLIQNENTKQEITANTIDPFLLEMLKAGGLIPLAPRLAGD